MWEVCNINKNEDTKRYYKEIESLLYYVFKNGNKLCRLYSCNAEIWGYHGVLALVSYGTPIAVCIPEYGALYDCLRVVYGYTATSSQHISKFRKWLSESNHPLRHAVRFTN